MKLFGCRIAYFLTVLLLVLICFQDLELGSSFNVEGRRVLGFREEAEVDRHGLVSNQRVEVDEDHGPCSQVGVLCENGRVVSLKDETAKFLRTNRRSASRRSIRKLNVLSPAGQAKLSGTDQNASASFPLVGQNFGHNLTFPPNGVFNFNVSPLSPPPPNPVRPPPPKPVRPPPPNLQTPHVPSEAATADDPHNQNLPIIIGVVIAAVLLVLAVSLVVFCRNKKVVDVKPQIRESLSGQLRKALVTGVPALNRSEVESACEDFSNEIGSLSDGKLYKGMLSAGTEIAVNAIGLGRNWTSHHEDQFKKKISIMSEVNHKNFVNLIGYCEEEESLSRMMVFEYASNGTLFEHLHSKEEDSDSLTWPQRSRIAMGAAYCLAHMHQLDPPVILQNLNSSSILLTDDFAAKIADMELQSQTTCIKTSSRNPGILLEEQMQKLRSLVHKYGTLLLELISGRPPNSDKYGGLVNWALEHLNGTKPLEEILDPTLTSFPADKLRFICHVIESCLNPDPKLRPSMQDATAQLREITGVTPDAAAPRLSPSWWTELEMVSLAVHPKME